MLSSEILYSLLANWDLEPVISIEVFDTADYRCSGNVVLIKTLSEKYVLKRRTAQSVRNSEYALLAALSAQGVPVAVPRLTRKGDYYAREGDAYFCLSPYLAGMVISNHFETEAEERARRFGIALAQLHIGLKQCEHLVMASEMDLLCDVAAASQVLCSQGTQNDKDLVQMALAQLKAGIATVNRDCPSS
jgi:Ser/Thr protein kinase RdoA (MazF antagonist)